MQDAGEQMNGVPLLSTVKALIAERDKLRKDAERMSGLRVTKDTYGAVLLHIDAPGGKKASISLDAIAMLRGGTVGATLLEWADAVPTGDRS